MDEKALESIARRKQGFVQTLGIRFSEARPDYVKAEMTIRDDLLQPHGFLHGGATISLLESVASLGAELRADLERERPFGVDIHVRHRNSVREGVVTAEAVLDHEEEGHNGSIKQFWNVSAHDAGGKIVSEGTIMCKVVSLEYLKARNNK